MRSCFVLPNLSTYRYVLLPKPFHDSYAVCLCTRRISLITASCFFHCFVELTYTLSSSSQISSSLRTVTAHMTRRRQRNKRSEYIYRPTQYFVLATLSIYTDRLSVCREHCDKTEERSVRISIPYERSFSLVFLEKSGWGDPFLKFSVNRPPLERNQPTFARSASAV